MIRRAATMILRSVALVSLGALLGIGVLSVTAYAEPADAQIVPPTPVYGGWSMIERYGVMTWTPTSIDPDSWYSGNSLVLESDLYFGSSFRVGGHDLTGSAADGSPTYSPTYEYEFRIDRVDVALGYTGTFICTLPSCVLDTNWDDSDNRSYAVVSDAPESILANTTYHVDIYTSKGSVTNAWVQHPSIAGARDDSCPHSAEWCSFENYRHYYNKTREIKINEYYGRHYGGSLITDNTFSPCPGSWGFSSGNVDYWCWSSTNGPEYPGRVTIRPKSGYSSGNAYRTVTFYSQGGSNPDNFSVEAVVQCLTGNPCEGYLGHQVLSGSQSVSYRRTPDFTVPNDGHYYLCRFDTAHDTTTSGYPNSTAIAAAGNNLRILVGNGKAGTQLRVDAVALYGHSGYWDQTYISQFGSLNGYPELDDNQCNRLP